MNIDSKGIVPVLIISFFQSEETESLENDLAQRVNLLKKVGLIDSADFFVCTTIFKHIIAIILKLE